MDEEMTTETGRYDPFLMNQHQDWMSPQFLIQSQQSLIFSLQTTVESQLKLIQNLSQTILMRETTPSDSEVKQDDEDDLFDNPPPDDPIQVGEYE